MAADPKKFDFTQAITQIEEINAWFQDEDFNLDEGLHKLKHGKELIKKCRTRLHEVENEFVKIKQEFAEETEEQEAEAVEEFSSGNGTTRKALTSEKVDPEDVPF
jgi:exodeoxyribonuclease VII small subunit